MTITYQQFKSDEKRYKKHIEYMKGTVICEYCGCSQIRANMSRHRKTQSHLDMKAYVESLKKDNKTKALEQLDTLTEQEIKDIFENLKSKIEK